MPLAQVNCPPPHPKQQLVLSSDQNTTQQRPNQNFPLKKPHLPQANSSDPSSQSATPSHFLESSVRHMPLLHWNLGGAHAKTERRQIRKRAMPKPHNTFFFQRRQAVPNRHQVLLTTRSVSERCDNVAKTGCHIETNIQQDVTRVDLATPAFSGKLLCCGRCGSIASAFITDKNQPHESDVLTLKLTENINITKLIKLVACCNNEQVHAATLM